jgi:hypothetical protein
MRFARTLLLILLSSVLPLGSAFAQQPDSVATNAMPSVTLPPVLKRGVNGLEVRAILMQLLDARTEEARESPELVPWRE